MKIAELQAICEAADNNPAGYSPQFDKTFSPAFCLKLLKLWEAAYAGGEDGIVKSLEELEK